MTKAKLTDEEKAKRNRRKKKLVKYNFTINHIQPKSDNQEKAFHSYFSGSNVLLHGVAGTGKTYLSMYFALCEIMSGRAEKIIIVRSTVQTRDMGFLPGTEEEKLSYYEQPYRDICSEILGKPDAYNKLKDMDAVKFVSTSFLRGTTLDNSVVIVDECQNMNFQEIDTILTRMGENSRLLICGDYRQNDLSVVGKRNDKSGIEKLIQISKKMDSIDLIEFEVDDIVRSKFVKEYIITKIKLNYE